MPYPRTLKWKVRAFLRAVIGCLILQCLTAEQLGKGYPVIQVQLWNRANVSPLVLTTAETKVIRVLERAGVRIDWVHCHDFGGQGATGECAGPVRPDQLVVELFSMCMGPSSSCDSSPLGLAVAHDPERLPYNALVFCREIESLADRYAIRRASVLGNVIAHVIGHLLIGFDSHGVDGVMKGNWGGKDVVLAAQGGMRLDKQEAARLRQAVIARSSIRRQLLETSNYMTPAARNVDGSQTNNDTLKVPTVRWFDNSVH
jgi:hypothetical protein